MVAYSIKSYQMDEEMYNFAIHTEKAQLTCTFIGLVLKHRQCLADKKVAPILH